MPVNATSVPMREQPVDIRRKNFNEVTFGYNDDEAAAEAARCLQCKNAPCIKGCPVGINIPAFICAIREKNYRKAIEIIYETDSLPCVTGRVCPQEEQCQENCVAGIKGEAISIGRLERFAADIDLRRRMANGRTEAASDNKKNGDRIAVVGSGPAGITCAADCIRMGYNVTVFEGFHKLGGVLMYGIPEFRLPKDIVSAEIDNVKALGVEFITDVLIGRALTIDQLFKDGFKAVFLGTGAGLPNFMNIPGENLNGVYSANEYLTRINLMKAYKYPEYGTPVKKGHNVAVIGGGNVAMDAARTALRIGAENVYLIYRRTEKEMPARLEETHHAQQEGIQFMMLCAPVKYTGNEKGFVQKMECMRMVLGEPDASGRRSPRPVEGSNFEIDVDVVIVAVGTTPNPLIARTTPQLAVTKHGTIPVDEQMMTNIPGVFAGGDIVTGAATVITAMGAGRKAAQGIDAFVKSKA